MGFHPHYAQLGRAIGDSVAIHRVKFRFLSDNYQNLLLLGISK